MAGGGGKTTGSGGASRLPPSFRTPPRSMPGLIISPPGTPAVTPPGDTAGFRRASTYEDDAQDSSSYMALLSALSGGGYLGDSGGGSSGGGASGGGGWAGGTWTPEMPGASAPGPHVAHVDTSAARAAEYARAKDQVGQTSSGAITALRSVLGSRGMLGSGAEARGAANVINAGQGQLGEVTRTGAIKDVDALMREAEENQKADLEQRAQDLAALTSRNSQRLTARGQDMSFADSAATRASTSASSRLAAILGLYSAFSRRRSPSSEGLY